MVSQESTYSDLAQVKVVDSYALPFSENFDSNSLDTNYWTVNNSTNNNWYTVSNSGVYTSMCDI